MLITLRMRVGPYAAGPTTYAQRIVTIYLLKLKESNNIAKMTSFQVMLRTFL